MKFWLVKAAHSYNPGDFFSLIRFAAPLDIHKCSFDNKGGNIYERLRGEPLGERPT